MKEWPEAKSDQKSWQLQHKGKLWGNCVLLPWVFEVLYNSTIKKIRSPKEEIKELSNKENLSLVKHIHSDCVTALETSSTNRELNKLRINLVIQKEGKGETKPWTLGRR